MFGKLSYCIDYVFINTGFNVMLLSTTCMLLFLLPLKRNNKEKGISSFKLIRIYNFQPEHNNIIGVYNIYLLVTMSN